MRAKRIWLRGLLLVFALVGCNREWDAAKGRAALRQAGYTVGEAAPGTIPSGVSAESSECFDVSRADKRARVCVWTCATAQACIEIPAQGVWLHGTFGRRNAYVDSQDEQFGNAILSELHR